MMKKKFQFYKNIILVVASALTLVAVTFAWFSTPKMNGVPGINQNVGAQLIDVDFYEKNNGQYTKMNGDIKLDNAVSGVYSQYKMIVKTFTNDKIKLSFGIDDLPVNLNQNLKDSVCIKYSLYTATKNADGTFTDGTCIVKSTDDSYVPLSVLSNGVIFDSISLSQYQEYAQYFVVYYEIGLSEDSTGVQGLSDSLGNVRLSAKLA